MDSSGPRDPRDRREDLPRARRVRSGEDIRFLLRHGTRHRGAALDVFAAATSGTAPRFGTVVPRYGRSAVERNRLRRRLRELGRREVLPRLRQAGCVADVLVRTRPRAYDASFTELQAELTRLTEGLCFDASF